MGSEELICKWQSVVPPGPVYEDFFAFSAAGGFDAGEVVKCTWLTHDGVFLGEKEWHQDPPSTTGKEYPQEA
jgi:hypothetical protein